mmetsp:Transcript_5161/g.9253  ORF Transcript_5161/g.9253 Transcript_5161/m.9253 type:complete len:81 (-) Transcript_5161:205-447(-)|eukprot:CAMPEP_0197685008 /NCGR_PEP_ID=MMETSP1338-20131121/100294_1 /TAXON_ID=43686 ORGANISM="Pelagodinium beii, Strain RCC1491" /NCGR_SAMPLE_ID=MMETSP1338 /ASSEMBLY_ACC=CAM_ASM_000754 /LENGTH=80 /DNA_ID=CAMNT_0043266789 /DNA_START=159 /DNA_END=401 /DNA_ORIENTATION=+
MCFSSASAGSSTQAAECRKTARSKEGPVALRCLELNDSGAEQRARPEGPLSGSMPQSLLEELCAELAVLSDHAWRQGKNH